jgi:hypothetical protein
MKVVRQLPMSCFLACLESFLADSGKTITQTDMIGVLHPMHLCSQDGVVNRGDEAKVCLMFGVVFRDVPFNYPVPAQYDDGSLLIGTSLPGNHCMRFESSQDSAGIRVMDPVYGVIRSMTEEELRASGPAFHELRTATAGGRSVGCAGGGSTSTGP